MWHMKKGIEIPPAVIVVVLIVVVALVGLIGYNKFIRPPQRVQMSPEAIKGMKEHMTGQGSGAGMPGPGGMSGQHSP
jgi:hypothetical protein